MSLQRRHLDKQHPGFGKRSYSPELLELRRKRGSAVEVAKVQKALKKEGSESEEHCVWSKERKGGDTGKQSL